MSYKLQTSNLPRSVATKRYARRHSSTGKKSMVGYRQGCFGKSHAEKTGYKPLANPTSTAGQ